jgi:hypothetical protein
MATQIPQIETYIREMIATNGGSFNREAILVKSREWMEKFPVEFNSVLNMIETEGRNVRCDEMMNDSMPSEAYGSRFANDSTPSAAYGSRYADGSTPSAAYHGCFDDDSTPSVAYGSRFDDDSTPSAVPHHGEYGGNIASDHITSVVESPIGSDHIDSSPGGYPDDDFESDMPLQRTMSCAPSRR